MKKSRSKYNDINRRQFIHASAALAGAALLSPWALPELRAAADVSSARPWIR